MKKHLALILVVLLSISVTGCGTEISDIDLLKQTYDNMQNMKSSKSEIAVTISMMDFTLAPIKYEVLYQPDKTYLKMDLDLFGTGEKTTFEILIEGSEVKLRSDMLEGVNEETQNAIRTAIIEDMENPQKYEGLFLEAQELTNYEVIDNADGLDAKKFKTFKITVDSETLKQSVSKEMREELENQLLQSPEELDPDELARLNAQIDHILANLQVEMEAVAVVNTEAKHFHSLEMDMSVKFPLFVGTETEQPEIVSTNYNIIINYLAINKVLVFPDFE